MASDARLAASGTSSPAQSSVSPSPAPAPTPAPATTTTTTTTTTAADSGFAFPRYYHYPPMFTLQPNLNTRRAQLDKWTALVLAYCRHYRIFRLVVGSTGSTPSTLAPGPVRVDGESSVSAAGGAGAGVDDEDRAPSIAYYAPDLFANPHIDRAMPAAEVRQVLDDMRKQGRVEFITGGDAATAAASDGTGPDAAAAAAVSVYVFWKTPEEWAAAVEAYVDDTAQRGSVLTLYELTAGDATRGTDLHGLDPAVLRRALTVLVKRGRAQVFGQEESLGVKFF